MKLPLFLLPPIQSACDRLLAEDKNCRDSLSKLKGKVIGVEVKGFGCRVYFLPNKSGLRLAFEHEGPADTLIKGMPSAFAKLAISKDAVPLLLDGDIEITGDNRLAQEFQYILSRLEIDWEELLSQYFGDMPVHLAGKVSREFSSGLLSLAESFANNPQAGMESILQKCFKTLPGKTDVEAFIMDVDKLRSDVDRIQMRMQHLR